MADISGQIGTAYQRIVDVYLQALSGDRTVTTLDLYRRSVKSSTNDLGIPIDPWVRIVTAQPCTVVGIKQVTDNGFELAEQGAVQFLVDEVICSLTDVRTGDNVVLALDGRVYHVERAEPMGTLTYLYVNHGRAQVKL